MMKLKDVLKEFFPTSSADSTWQRSTNTKKVVHKKEKDDLEKGEDDQNLQQADGSEIAKRMDFDKEEPHSIYDKKPFKVMDYILRAWGLEPPKDNKPINKKNK